MSFAGASLEQLKAIDSGLLWNYLYRGEIPKDIDSWSLLVGLVGDYDRKNRVSIVPSDLSYHRPADLPEGYVAAEVSTSKGVGVGRLVAQRDLGVDQESLPALVACITAAKITDRQVWPQMRGLVITGFQMDLQRLAHVLAAVPYLQRLELVNQAPMDPRGLAQAVGVLTNLRQLVVHQPIDCDELSLTTPQLTHLTVPTDSAPGRGALARWQEGLVVTRR
jgi:hypothetical protein